MTELVLRIAGNLSAIRQRVEAAAVRSGRAAEEISLIAVTKYVGAAEAAALVAAGCAELGESRPQDLWAKAAALSGEAISWHLIGHLQRNKVRRTLPLVSLLHSVDSQRLAVAIDEEAAATGRRVRGLLEVNVSGDAAKHGFAPLEVERVLPQLIGLRNLEIVGLMTMAGRAHGLDESRRDFERLRELRDRLQASAAGQLRLDELSMGMSGDFEAAILEGATLVRIGSALFEGIVP